MTITSQMVKELREKTNAGMMDCKKALTETDGNMEKAVDLLRQKGLAVAAKRSGKEAKEGTIAAYVQADGRAGALVEVACETDFVAKTDDFRTFASGIAEHIAAAAPAPEKLLGQHFVKNERLTVQDALNELVVKMGESISVRKFSRYQLEGAGIVVDYIHAGGKLGVLVEAACDSAAASGTEAFRTTVRDIAMHIAATNPLALKREELSSELVQREREIYIKQALDSGKPQQIAEKMVMGKMEKYLSEICLLEQRFVKDDKLSVQDLLAQLGKQLGAKVTITRFTRYQIA